MVICLELGADLHMAQLMPLPLTVSCFNKIQIGFTFLLPADPSSPGKGAVKRVCVCVCVGTHTFCHESGAEYCDQHVCIEVSILAYLRNHVLFPNFYILVYCGHDFLGKWRSEFLLVNA